MVLLKINISIYHQGHYFTQKSDGKNKKDLKFRQRKV